MSLLPRRNVILHDFDGNVIAGETSTTSPDVRPCSRIPGFWQYGSVSWTTFWLWLNSLIQTEQQCAVFDLDETSPNRHGGQRSLDSEIVPPGDYILLREGTQLLFQFYDNVFTALQTAAPCQLL